MILKVTQNTLQELATLVCQLTDAEYTKPCASLSNTTIGEHSRHIIEMFQCLETQYESGKINYDLRERNQLIQNYKAIAVTKINQLLSNIDKPNKKFTLEFCFEGKFQEIETNYNRELLYNLEHCTHHQALIKVALLQYGIIVSNENFGVAHSTIEYKNKCVQ